jgi:hypothetical protein
MRFSIVAAVAAFGPMVLAQSNLIDSIPKCAVRIRNTIKKGTCAENDDSKHALAATWAAVVLLILPVSAETPQ